MLLVVRDDEYPPQKKAFAMLEHICQHYSDKYKWFVRADDDSYFKFSNLRHLLHSLNEDVPVSVVCFLSVQFFRYWQLKVLFVAIP